MISSPSYQKFTIMPIGSIISGLFGLASSSMNAANQYAQNAQNQRYTQENMKLQNKLNKDEKSFQDSLNRRYQDFIWNNQYGKSVGGMKAAGLNPADNGTSIGGMSASNNVSAGPSGPAFHGSMADLSGSFMQGVMARKEIEMLDAQKKNIEADTNKKNSEAASAQAEADFRNWQNSPQYRSLLEQNLSADSLQKIYMAYKSNSDVSVNDSVVERNMRESQHLSVLCGLDSARTTQAMEDVGRIKAETASIYQGMKESKARTLYYVESARAQKAAAAEYYAGAALKGAQTETENKLRGSRMENLDTQSTLYREHAREADSRIKLNSREQKLKDAYLRMYEVYTPDERAAHDFANGVKSIINPLEGVIGKSGVSTVYHR